MSSKLLLDKHPIVITPELAKAVGLNEAIVLQQVHYWLKLNEDANRNEYNGHHWTYGSYEDWQRQFPWWSGRSIRRIFKGLETRKLLIVAVHNKAKFDQTRWYRIDYQKLDKAIQEHNKYRYGQIGHIHADKMATPIPETIEPEIMTGLDKLRYDTDRMHRQQMDRAEAEYREETG